MRKGGGGGTLLKLLRASDGGGGGLVKGWGSAATRHCVDYGVPNRTFGPDRSGSKGRISACFYLLISRLRLPYHTDKTQRRPEPNNCSLLAQSTSPVSTLCKRRCPVERRGRRRGFKVLSPDCGRALRGCHSHSSRFAEGLVQGRATERSPELDEIHHCVGRSPPTLAHMTPYRTPHIR